MGKRKKLKSRNSTTLPASILNSSIGSGGGGYSKDHLDAWLETCLKDASTTQLSSSSEFLDYNPTVKTSTSNSANNLNQKNLLSQQQQQSPIFNMANMGQQQQQQQQAMNLQQQQQQQQFAMRTSSNPLSNNLPNTNNFNFPFSQGFQRVRKAWQLFRKMNIHKFSFFICEDLSFPSKHKYLGLWTRLDLI